MCVIWPHKFQVICLFNWLFHVDLETYMSDHAHTHDHAHHGHDGDDLVEANKKFFSDLDYKEVKMTSDPTFDLQNLINRSVVVSPQD